MIFCFTAFVAAIVYALFAEDNWFFAVFLVAVVGFLGGIWAAIDEKENQP